MFDKKRGSRTINVVEQNSIDVLNNKLNLVNREYSIKFSQFINGHRNECIRIVNTMDLDEFNKEYRDSDIENICQMEKNRFQQFSAEDDNLINGGFLYSSYIAKQNENAERINDRIEELENLKKENKKLKKIHDKDTSLLEGEL